MKSLVAGLFAFGLTVWPIALVQWSRYIHIHSANVHATASSLGGIIPLMLMSLLAGLIVAICGTRISSDKADSTLHFIGRGFCIITFCMEGVIVIWMIYGFAQFSRFGVN